MNIALIGLPKSGKTTIFNALTGLEAETGEYTSRRVEPNRGVVTVEDPRVDELSRLYAPRKTIYATVEFVDFAGLTSDSQGELFTGEGLQLVKSSDALAAVVRNFSDEVLDSTYGAPDPAAEAEQIYSELLLSDQILAEKRIERIHADIQRGRKTSALESEKQVLQRIVDQLEEGYPVRDAGLTEEEKKKISGFQFFTAKPLFVILNSGEERYGAQSDEVRRISGRFPVVEFAGSFEMELSRLDDPESQKAFMDDFGISESARKRLTSFAYSALGYITFFTVGQDEVRAWAIHSGSDAVEAAGTVHSDLARGFIRAEVFSFDDLTKLGSEKAVKAAGKFRVEGKQYIVHDGDILNIRFSV